MQATKEIPSSSYSLNPQTNSVNTESENGESDDQIAQSSFVNLALNQLPICFVHNSCQYQLTSKKKVIAHGRTSINFKEIFYL